jgi:hypothetical protein
MFQLPLELQYQCVRSFDVATLKSFRLVNKSALALATEILFGTINLLPTDNSAENYTQILDDAKLSRLVRRVIFNTSEDPLEDDRDEEEESEFLDSFKNAMLSVTKFPRLEEVELRFARACSVPGAWNRYWPQAAETRAFRMSVLNSLFAGLNEERHPSAHVQSLTIKNLQDGTDESLYDSSAFQSVMEKVKRLHLQVTTEHYEPSPEVNIDLDSCQNFFKVVLPQRWLKPMQSQLTHLTLYSSQCEWGFWPPSDLREVHFPVLKSIALGNWTIVHEWQIDWLLSHGQTLEELILDECPIVTALMMGDKPAKLHWPDLPILWTNKRFGTGYYFKEFSLRWHHVLPRFQSSMPLLRHFAMGRGDWSAHTMFEDRYHMKPKCLWGRYYMFNIGRAPSPFTAGDGHWVLAQSHGDPTEGPVRKCKFRMSDVPNLVDVFFPTCDEEDMEALVKLLDVVEGRACAKV